MEYVFNLARVYSAVQLMGIQYSRTESGWSYPNHRHAYLEFLYCESGEIEQWVNGIAYRMLPGDAMIIQGGHYHRSLAMSKSTFFDFHFIVEMKEVHSVFRMQADPMIRAPRDGSENGISRWVNEFKMTFGKELQARNGGADDRDFIGGLYASISRLHMHAKVLELISMLARNVLSSAKQEFLQLSPVPPAQMKIAHEASYYLETHMSEKLNVQSLAKHLNIHRSYLTQCFKKVYGTSPSAYLLDIRIRQAKMWLIESELSVEEISQKLAFSSLPHFSQTFRSVMGLPPQQFRRQMKQSDG